MTRAIRKADSVKDAVKAFVGLQHVGLDRDTEVYNCFLHRVAKDKQWEQVLQAFRQMLDAGVATNSDTYSALLGACIKGSDSFPFSLDILSLNVLVYVEVEKGHAAVPGRNRCFHG